MNYHTLSDFRVAHAEVLDRLLAGGVAALVEQGLVALDVLAQDGLKVRAAAGAGSFRRRERLGKLAAAAKARVERLRAELEADPAAGDRRQQAAQQRAAREREERVKAALDRMSENEAERARREKTNKAEVSGQEPRRDDKPGVADWRRRMASEPGKALYKQRAQAECPNAWARRMGLTRLSVRGTDKARAVLLWFALAHNMLRAFALRLAAMATAT